ncbi:MAG: Sec-independent protein translocase protein TatB [Gammaproteobacteria bacterium]|mgnify:FL=1|jgi:sec-independent protein translocase protein TatB|nr:twin-arginine translocase subunit TatB [Pseudomonadota bacterium]MDG2302296.1 Sec-independent protein translocase protein TatB [Gammaproteobacteria bacterium]MBT5065795.1 twin-arginine translocase subunit TatB [Pseudomonadota bacterium]MBT6192796.1 twin-arginine translocase subunit TatB [Pseudomonadota bacterium]MBT6465018.1 twin-arginine translocase subunit TatB [Pseudomonadota bacterium]
MFDIGFWELGVIFVIALIVVGPEKMPGLIKGAGQWIGKIQRTVRSMRYEIEKEAQTAEYRQLNKEFLEEDKQLKDLAREPFNDGISSQDRPPQPPDEKLANDK